MTTIVVTLDGSKESTAALDLLGKLPFGPASHVRLLTVLPPPNATLLSSTPSPEGAMLGGFPLPGVEANPELRFQETLDQAMERAMAEGHGFLERFAEPLRANHASVETVVLVEDDIVKAIVDYLRENNVDLVVMATHGRSGISELVFGSVAGEVVKAGVAPVLLIRPPM